MALKLGKCRLCLKLGDFYSIFTQDNSILLAEMAMECARVKIYDGDGLPDKVCSECIQKLSSAYIFKQQCERADQELRRNYIPPPGFSISPPPTNRQSSDSAFSNNTNISNITKPSSSIEEKISPAARNRKRSIESDENISVGGRSSDFRPTSTKRVTELRNSQKRARLQSENNSQQDSDYEDTSGSYIPETDSDEPLLKNFTCNICCKEFTTYKTLAIHKTRMHDKKSEECRDRDANVETPKKNEDALDVEDKLSCTKCAKTFKLKIMLKRHSDLCGKAPEKPSKELLVSLEPLDVKKKLPISNDSSNTCEYCFKTYKSLEGLAKHLKIVHAAVLKNPPVPNKKVPVPCLYCNTLFHDYYLHNVHFVECPKMDEDKPYECPVCKRLTSRRSSYYQHIKNVHFEPRSSLVETDADLQEYHECRMCYMKLPSSESLIQHLKVHVAKRQEDSGGDNDSRASVADDAASVHSAQSGTYPPKAEYSCDVCGKEFKYKKALTTHRAKFHTEVPVEFKQEKPDVASTSQPSEQLYYSDSDSSQEETDNTCDICEKRFSYRRTLLHHKKVKHHMSSGHKRAKVHLKDCLVRCLLCDFEMKVSDINEHNQTHIAKNIKPRNLYTCGECEAIFKSCSGLADHIKLVHRLKQKTEENSLNPSDFCEVVVTKPEPLDWSQGHNDDSKVPDDSNGKPLVNLSGFTCPICEKKMPTLISLKRHVNWHTNVGKNLEKKYECFVCKESFRFQRHYKLHMRDHYTDPNLDPALLTCSICGRKSKNLRAAQAHTTYHKQTRFQNKDYQCSICERVFQYRKVYLSHMSIHYKRGDSAQNTIVGDIIPNNVDKTIFDGSHTCQHCGKVCDSENSLKCHLNWHNSKTFLFGARHECRICKVKFTNKRRLEIHTRTHFEDENGPYKCNICGKGYTDEGYFKRHVKGHNFDHQSHKNRLEKFRKDKVKCPICSRYYKDFVKLIRHLRRTHPESKMIKTDPDAPPPPYYSCKLCAKVFLEERRLQAHEEAHLRKPEFFKCKFCGKKTISLKNHRIHIKGHLTQKYIDNPLKCQLCDDTFGRGYDLHYHMREVHNIEETWIAERTEKRLTGPLKDLQCSICMKVLASKGNFERHLDYHNSLRCNYCFDYFSSLRFLEGHLAFSCEKKKLLGDTETYPRKIKCHICYKAFHVQVKLDCHLNTQHDIKVRREASSNEKEIVCDYCFKVFENNDALTTHKVYHRTIGYYGCLYCKRKFNTITLYNKHKNHHFSQLNVDDPTKCEHCDETFVAFRDMIYHMRDVHGDDKEWITMPKEVIEETCKICNKTFFNLHRHMSYHEENRCKKCGEYFFSTADLDNHLCTIESDEEVNSNLESYEKVKYEECAFCFKPTTRQSSKAKHDHIHKGSGSISCRFCSLKFKTMDAFNIHAFSHRNRKYHKKPIKCRQCGEKFVKYGLFIKHLKIIHKSLKKMHYRAIVKPERCVVCGDEFPNLHNHYRAHLLNQCQNCHKYFTSSKIFSNHKCDKEDSDPSKVFVSDANLNDLINSYVPKDLKDDEKYYGHTDDEEDETEEILSQICGEDDESQDCKDFKDIDIVHEDILTQPISIQSPIISDVLSLYQKEMTSNGANDDNIVNITDDESVEMNYMEAQIDEPILIDDDD